MLNKPSLSKGKTLDLEEKGSSRPSLRMPGSEAIVIDSPDISGSVNKWVKLVTGFVAFAIILVSFVYIGLAATLMTSVPSDDGRLWIARGTFVGNMIPEGSLVYASTSTPRPQGIVDKTVEGFIGTPNSIVVRTIAGPYAEIGISPSGLITVDGQETTYSGNVNPGTLNRQYLVTTEEGQYLVIPESYMNAEVEGRISLSGITKLN